MLCFSYNTFDLICLQQHDMFQVPSYNGMSGVETLNSRTTPCIMKTHLPARILKKHIDNEKVKIIVVIRNPKDTLVSLYHFYRMNSYLGNFPGTWDDFFELFRTKHMLIGDYFDWYDSWFGHLKNPNVLFVSYEDMSRSLLKVIDRLCGFLGQTLTGDQKAVVLEHTSFINMRQNKMTNQSLVLPHMSHGTSPFMRKGQVGDWKNYFNQEQSDYVDKCYKEKLLCNGIELTFD